MPTTYLSTPGQIMPSVSEVKAAIGLTSLATKKRRNSRKNRKSRKSRKNRKSRK